MDRLGGAGWTRRASVTAAFAALIAIATVSFSVSVPATKGYFNIGETAIYISAMLFGASIGGLSAGVGSMIADLVLGYTWFAPATLVVKGLEGAIVGFLAKREPEQISEMKLRRFLAVFTTIIFSGIVAMVGSSYYAGSTEFASSVTPAGVQIDVPTAFWVALALIIAASTLYISLRRDPGLSWQILAVLVGGAIMVTGYFLYEQLILGVAAIVEIPVNIGQMMIGAVVAIPIVRAIKARVPQLAGRR